MVRDNEIATSSVIPLQGAASMTYEQLVEAFLAHGRETPTLLQAFIDEEPENPRAHATRALMLTMLARSELRVAALESATRAVDLASSGTPHAADIAFVEAASAAAGGEWWRAIEGLERALIADASDTLSAKMSHAFRFMLGDKSGMLRSSGRALNRLPRDHAHRGFLLGCHAFALEENGQYADAERTGRAAVAIEGRDAWGRHAVSHVHEMTGRADDGIAWIESSTASIGHCNNFGGHLFWHLALFKLDKNAVSEVFDLYDHKIRADFTDDFRDIANATSLLMRLELDGHDVGIRWEELADKAEARLKDRSLVFADLHYMLALLGAGREASAARLAISIAHEPAGYAAQNRIADQAGRALAGGMARFGIGDMQGALGPLLAARRHRAVIGGSDAQRDLFEQITIEAALRAGEDSLARSLLAERLRARSGTNRFAEFRLAQLMRPGGGRRGSLGLVAAMAFATPAH
jgi:hypothetical protein